MRRLVSVLLVVAACGGTTVNAGTTVPGDPDTSTTDAPPSSQAPAASTSTTEATRTTDSGRPAAPDFTLELGDGGSYSLSDGAKPVYLVFWAEW